MTAPESVVQAVAKVLHDGQETGFEWESYPSSWWDQCREDARPMADAAFAASLEWAASRMRAAGPAARQLPGETLRRWARGDR